MIDYSKHAVLDLFAGTGVGVALQQLGATEYGVENMKEAVASRDAAGMVTPYRDVWDAHLAEGLTWDTLHASPSCQTYSMAGNGAGRKALDDVLGTLRRGVWKDIDELREWAASLGDERIGIVLVPLHYVWRFRPTYVSLEQVPPVLPVWEAYAEVLGWLGYSVATGNVQAEQFGVPQTRKRAILVARLDGGEARLPAPTHSRYYPRSPGKLDPGVEKWVSMADALGSGMTARSYLTIAGGDRARGGALGGTGAWEAVRRERDEGRWADVQRPSPTVTGGGTATGGAEPFGMAARDALRREQLRNRRQREQAGCADGE